MIRLTNVTEVKNIELGGRVCNARTPEKQKRSGVGASLSNIARVYL